MPPSSTLAFAAPPLSQGRVLPGSESEKCGKNLSRACRSLPPGMAERW